MGQGTHTPGPWVANEHHSREFPCWRIETDHYANGGCLVASELEGPDAEANARLIAAAPDMLSALKTVHLMLEASEKLLGVDLSDSDAMDEVEAAIRKAEGL